MRADPGGLHSRGLASRWDRRRNPDCGIVYGSRHVQEDRSMPRPGRGGTSGHSHRPADFLRPVLLLLLAEEPTYGYDLLERLQAFGFPRDPGGTYRALHALERERLVRIRTRPSSAGPEQLIYHVTGRGRRHLDGAATDIGRTRVEVAQFLHRHSRLVSRRYTRASLSPISEALLRLAVR